MFSSNGMRKAEQIIAHAFQTDIGLIRYESIPKDKAWVHKDMCSEERMRRI
jgi:hypothetical protein